MLYNILIEFRDDDHVWHGYTSTRARNAAVACGKIQRIAPFTKVSVREPVMQACEADYRGDRKANGRIVAMMLPEYNDGMYADRVYNYTDGRATGVTDLTLIEEESVAHAIRSMIEVE